MDQYQLSPSRAAVGASPTDVKQLKWIAPCYRAQTEIKSNNLTNIISLEISFYQHGANVLPCAVKYCRCTSVANVEFSQQTYDKDVLARMI